MQTLPAAGLPGGGWTYCGPVAASNGLIWLARSGYPHLTAARVSSHNQARAQANLARVLGCYMGTTPRRGTDVARFLNGLNNYLGHHWCAVDSLKYQGWEPHPREFSSGVTRPDLDWIKSGLDPDAVAWLMVGWYRYLPRQDRYQLHSQHWLTVVGAGRDRDGKPSANTLIVHDSAARSGPNPHHDYVVVEPIQHGSFARYGQRQQLSARGWYKLGGDLKLKSSTHCGIIDGAIVLRLRPNSNYLSSSRAE